MSNNASERGLAFPSPVPRQRSKPIALRRFLAVAVVAVAVAAGVLAASGLLTGLRGSKKCGPEAGAGCEGATLAAASWANHDLDDIDLRGSRASGMDFSFSSMHDGDLSDGKFDHAKFMDTSLRGANLRNSDLSAIAGRGVDFYDTDLRGANLEGADLRLANFERSQIEGANLAGADLRGAVWIDGSTLCGPSSFGRCSSN